MMNKGWIVGTVAAVLAVPSVGMARYTGRMPAGIAAAPAVAPAATEVTPIAPALHKKRPAAVKHKAKHVRVRRAHKHKKA